MYLIYLTIGLCFAYVLFYFLFPLFFKNTIVPLNRRSLYSVIFIITFSFLVYFVSFRIADWELGNRILHIFGGGFLTFLICFFAVRNGVGKVAKSNKKYIYFGLPIGLNIIFSQLRLCFFVFLDTLGREKYK
ncbi:MAG: hypothetical protein UW30_C0011G0002 [Candidatus Giovannonibacteria bacterium GW2011_GWA2_44_13b]|uniref:Uncharacterized protein n=2 Tax=Candidatus Giovannoniibacteriota TaxID=1752738 RepID=A0A0G1H1D2_9BACT|nr:MAG: hypothetical protein UW30_C0011G0002 [Candidatus Giovannonibacteria bacterium GW2011_GWA2_44_13b]OGF82063.1 MAG: hypothetical protein A2924_01860 [Candidatus Giovannonibacteria bacterium RIFCSPLOWO2_01_FULL_44_16]